MHVPRQLFNTFDTPTPGTYRLPPNNPHLPGVQQGGGIAAQDIGPHRYGSTGHSIGGARRPSMLSLSIVTAVIAIVFAVFLASRYCHRYLGKSAIQRWPRTRTPCAPRTTYILRLQGIRRAQLEPGQSRSRKLPLRCVKGHG